MPRRYLSYSLLEPGPADDRGAVHRCRCSSLAWSSSSVGDRAEVAEQVRGVDAVRRRVGAHVLRLGEHRREVLALLHDRDRDLLRGRPWRPGPAGRASRSSRCPATDPARRTAACVAWTSCSGRSTAPREPAAAACCSSSVILCSSVRSTVTTHDVRLATSGRPMSSTIRPRGRLHDDVADRLLGGLGLVAVAAEHLEVPQPPEERQEQRRAPAPGSRPSRSRPLSRRARRPAAAAAGSVATQSRPSVGDLVRLQAAEQPHHQRQHERRQQHVVERPRPGSPQRLADRDAPGRAAACRTARRSRCRRTSRRATVSTAATAERPASWRTRPAR